jgi:hypothetical protein
VPTLKDVQAAIDGNNRDNIVLLVKKNRNENAAL